MSNIDYSNIDSKSSEHLAQVMRIFSDLDAEVWIDQGTLLGAVRDNGFIPWDWDIDLSAWYGDWVYDSKVKEAFEKAGFELIYLEKSRSMRIEPTIKYPGWRQIDVHLYQVDGNHALTYFFEFDVNNHIQKWLFKLIMRLDSLQRSLINEPPALKLVLKHPEYITTRGWYRRGAVRNGLFRLLKRVKHQIFMFRFKRYANLRKVQTPVFFYKELTKQSLLGGVYLAPKDIKRYLMFKYGANWKVPIKDYDWRTDGSVVANASSEYKFSS